MNTQRGIVILFAVLTIGLLVGVGVAMATLTQKQLILSNIGKQSQVAFYAADTGAECARYWDHVQNAFSATTTETFAPYISCAGLHSDDPSEIPLTVGLTTDTTVTVEFDLPLTDDSFVVPYYYCANVTVDKNLETGETVIVSRGYNLPCSANSSPRKVERAVRLSY